MATARYSGGGGSFGIQCSFHASCIPKVLHRVNVFPFRTLEKADCTPRNFGLRTGNALWRICCFLVWPVRKVAPAKYFLFYMLKSSLTLIEFMMDGCLSCHVKLLNRVNVYARDVITGFFSLFVFIKVLNNKLNRIHERALRIAYKDMTSDFDMMLLGDNAVTILIRNMQLLMTDIYRTKFFFKSCFSGSSHQV